jgi:RNA polymerase sigma-70 factor, ECF subfamily
MAPGQRPAQEPPPQQADERLLVKAAQADPSKFDVLYELHFERIYFFIVSRVHDRAIAEDLTSETFQKALASLSTYEWRGTPFSAWLYRIASNAIVDHYKRSSRERLSPDPSVDLREGVSDVEPTARELTAIDHHMLLFQLVDRLPGLQRQVIYERFVEQRNVKEIAERLKKTEGAIKQLQFRALQALRAEMEGSHA